MARTRTIFAMAVAFTLPFLTLSSRALAGDSNTCDVSTLKGTYVYAYTGFSGSRRDAIRFAVAGNATFKGDGTLEGVSTTATEGQAPALAVKYTGTYKISPDCTINEIDTDQNGVVTHYDDFTNPAGNKISFVETDPDVVTSGTETRE